MVFSKKSLFLFVLFSLTFSLLFGQTAPSTGSGTVNENEISITLSDNFSQTGDANSSSSRKKSSVWPFIKMIICLVLVVAAIYGVLFFVRRKANPAVSDDNFLRRVAYLNLGQGKSVEVVTLVDKGAYLIGVTEGSINLISEIKDVELIQAMNLYSDKQKNVSKPKNFSDVLEMFMPGGPKDNGIPTKRNQNIFSSESANGENMFQSGADNE